MPANWTALRLAGGRAYPVVVVLMLLWAVTAALAVTFPPLTGRIVDQANIIPNETRNAIEPKLADLEAKSGIQLVVATVTSLEGIPIACCRVFRKT